MSKEAMKLALEALERYQVKRQDFDRFADEITALREALAEQPAQQEPVALNRAGMQKLLEQSGYDGACPEEKAAFLSGARHREAETLDAAPQPAQPSKPFVGLTEQEAAECWSTSTVRTWQAIEAKLKEKNA